MFKSVYSLYKEVSSTLAEKLHAELLDRGWKSKQIKYNIKIITGYDTFLTSISAVHNKFTRLLKNQVKIVWFDDFWESEADTNKVTYHPIGCSDTKKTTINFNNCFLK